MYVSAFVAASCSTSTQDGLGLLQLALVVLYRSSHQLVQIHNFCSWWSSPATFTGGALYIIYSEYCKMYVT